MIHDRFFVKLDELVLDVFVIGYPEKGESIVILLKDDMKTYFSCVIDCYKHNSINKTIEILKANNIQSLDAFIWTHTDEDHSVDIEELVKQFCTKTTRFFLPELVYGNIEDFVNYSKEISDSLKLINSFNSNRNYAVSSATATPYGHSNIWRNEFIDIETTTKLLFEIITVAPCSALLRRRADNGEVTKKNDLSIATIFKVGTLNLFMSSDIENQTIAQIADYHFENIFYIKTPHHTSSTSTLLVDKILNNSPIKSLKSVSTVYKQNNLPHPDVVDQYKKISNSFISTGLGQDDFGIDNTCFHVLTNTIKSEARLGNCHKVF